MSAAGHGGGTGRGGEALAAAAAAFVVDDGMEYAAAKRKAARDRSRHGERAGPLPSNEQLEAAVREHIVLFHNDTQPAELRALRELALQWMERLSTLRPHLGGAAWRGTATRRSALHVDLYCDDPKVAEIELLNRGLHFDVDLLHERPGQEPRSVLTLAAPCPALGETVTLHLCVRDLDEQRGALKPDAQGRSWRGDAGALRRLLATEPAA
ncbi:MAG: hypothetical protein ABI696_09390 [Rubrivivax sp.]